MSILLCISMTGGEGKRGRKVERVREREMERGEEEQILPLSSEAGSPVSTSVCSCNCLVSSGRCGD